MIGSSLFSPIPSNAGESKIDFMSGVIIMLLNALRYLMILKHVERCRIVLNKVSLSQARTFRSWNTKEKY